jgi:hypothetical protein
MKKKHVLYIFSIEGSSGNRWYLLAQDTNGNILKHLDRMSDLDISREKFESPKKFRSGR